MHRTAIEPGVTSDISVISPKVGSVGGMNSSDRLISNANIEIKQLQLQMADLLKRVKDLETKASISPVEELKTIFDNRYLMKDGPEQTVKGQVIFSGIATFNDQRFSFGWRWVTTDIGFFIFKRDTNYGQTA